MRHWLLIFLVVYGIFNALPFVAPALMETGWTGGGNAIYTFYSALCHQMAQRSFFLFGDHVMHNLDQFPVALTGRTGTDTLLLRNFRGNEMLGWKVAWSDRMVSMYGGIWLVGMVYGLVSRVRSHKPISVWMFALLALPMVIDGGTHMVGDSLGGLTTGFRYHNDWLASLTGHALPESFYSGDALGSFNSWMRLLTGLLFAVGTVWFAFPWMDRYARSTQAEIDNKLSRIAEAQRRLSTQRDEALERVKTLAATERKR
jgi:uncharacterized membrane protein